MITNKIEILKALKLMGEQALLITQLLQDDEHKEETSTAIQADDINGGVVFRNDDTGHTLTVVPVRGSEGMFFHLMDEDSNIITPDPLSAQQVADFFNSVVAGEV